MRLFRWYAYHETHFVRQFPFFYNVLVLFSASHKPKPAEVSVVLSQLLHKTTEAGRIEASGSEILTVFNPKPEGEDLTAGLEDIITIRYLRQLLVHFRILPRTIAYEKKPIIIPE